MSKYIQKILVIPIYLALYNLINFDHSHKLDYTTYKENYESAWGQFEILFELMMDIFRYFNLDFDVVWAILVISQLALISYLFNKRLLFVFALPNIIFLSQGFLGTQIRFSLSILLFFALYKIISSRKGIFSDAYLVIAAFIHFGATIIIGISLFVKRMLNLYKPLWWKNNILLYMALVLAMVISAFAMDTLLITMDYYYYVDSKYQSGKSIQSLLYIAFSLFFCVMLAATKIGRSGYQYVLIGVTLCIFVLIFQESSVISGRFTLVYVLIEPYIIYYAYKNWGIKNSNFPFFLFLISILYSKTLTTSYII